MKNKKTDLTKIMTVSGRGGLFRYVSQARKGVIVESIETEKRSCFGLAAGISSLHDISIYTDDGEVKLREVFEKMHEVLGDENAPSKNASSEEFISFFAEVLPNYDEDRFYVSHMKKVAKWYNLLKEYGSLDFADTDAETAAGKEEVVEEESN